MRPDIPNLNAEIPADKQVILDEIRREVDEMRDGLGRRMDEGIKDAVVYAKALGLETYQSCEGHVEVDGEEHNPAPYVHFQAAESPEEADEEIQQIYSDVIGGNFDKIRGQNSLEPARIKIEEDLDTLHKEGKVREVEYIRQWIEKNAALFQQARDLVNEFYADREIDPESQLVVTGAEEGMFSIEVNAGRYEEIEGGYMTCINNEPNINPENRVSKVARWQEEMSAFTEFLKNKFLET